MARASSGIFAPVEALAVTKLSGVYLRQATGIGASFAITKDMPSFIFIKATTARNVLLPAVTADVDGRILYLYNEGTATITLQTSSGAGLSPAVTLAGANTVANMMALFAGLAATAAWKKIGV